MLSIRIQARPKSIREEPTFIPSSRRLPDFGRENPPTPLPILPPTSKNALFPAVLPHTKGWHTSCFNKKLSHQTFKTGGENELQKMRRADGSGKVFIHIDRITSLGLFRRAVSLLRTDRRSGDLGASDEGTDPPLQSRGLAAGVPPDCMSITLIWNHPFFVLTVETLRFDSL